MQKTKLFYSKNAKQTFFVLVIGLLVIYGAALYLGITYIQNRYIRVTPRHLTELVRATVQSAQASKQLDRAGLWENLRRFNRRGFRVRVEFQPGHDAIIIKNTQLKNLAQLVLKNQNHLRISLPVAGGLYVNMYGRVIEHRWLLFGFILTTIILVAATIFLCYWSTRRLAFPVQHLVEATKRFGVDVQAPPMAETGPSEVREVIQAFNEMQGRIRRLLHDRTTMLAAISHDLRTPITRLQLRAEYLKGSPQYEKAIADLKDMERMITSILSFARDHVRNEVAERFDINALLESLCHDFVDSGHEVNYCGSERRVPYYGRLSAIKRAINNLIENAIKYGNNKAQVTLITKPDQIHIRIDDEGPGIPPDVLEKVFEPFYRVDSARSPNSASGVGLGMAVARDIIIAHGGEIKLLNREPAGLSVWVTLPLGN